MTDYQRESIIMQNYLFNGKERLDALDLNWDDCQARQYNPALGKFFAMDPSAHKYSSVTPYHYVYNNPLKYVDGNGKDATIAIAGDVITVSATIYSDKGQKTHFHSTKNRERQRAKIMFTMLINPLRKSRVIILI
jgi:RHS repeat-associated protein